MIEKYCRCKVCGISYIWNSYDRCQLSSTKYCKECNGKIVEVIENIPKKFEKRDLDIFNTSVEELIEMGIGEPLANRFKMVTKENIDLWKKIQDGEIAKLRAEGKVVGTRVEFPLYKIVDIQYVFYVTPQDPVLKHLGRLKVSYWSLDGSEYKVTATMEFDLSIGKYTGQFWG